jgi:hypothetical protein
MGSLEGALSMLLVPVSTGTPFHLEIASQMIQAARRRVHAVAVILARRRTG